MTEGFLITSIFQLADIKLILIRGGQNCCLERRNNGSDFQKRTSATLTLRNYINNHVK